MIGLVSNMTIDLGRLNGGWSPQLSQKQALRRVFLHSGGGDVRALVLLHSTRCCFNNFNISRPQHLRTHCESPQVLNATFWRMQVAQAGSPFQENLFPRDLLIVDFSHQLEMDLIAPYIWVLVHFNILPWPWNQKMHLNNTTWTWKQYWNQHRSVSKLLYDYSLSNCIVSSVLSKKNHWPKEQIVAWRRSFLWQWCVFTEKLAWSVWWFCWHYFDFLWISNVSKTMRNWRDFCGCLNP